jgi:hypothetical protein
MMRLRTAVIMVVLVGGCADGSASSPPRPPQPPETILKGSIPATPQTPTTPLAYVFRSEEAARDTLTYIDPVQRSSFHAEPPLVAVLGGSRPDSGYQAIFRSFDHESPGPIVVTADVERKGGLAAQVFSVPYVLVSLRGFTLGDATRCELRIGDRSFPCRVV